MYHLQFDSNRFDAVVSQGALSLTVYLLACGVISEDAVRALRGVAGVGCSGSCLGSDCVSAVCGLSDKVPVVGVEGSRSTVVSRGGGSVSDDGISEVVGLAQAVAGGAALGLDGGVGSADGCVRSDGISGVCQGTALVRGRHYKKNRSKKERKEKKKNRLANVPVMVERPGFPVDAPISVERSGLRSSLEAKWKAENKLAELRAMRELEVLQSLDVDDEKRKKRAQVTAATERSLVSIERAHGALKRNGNSTAESDQRVRTVISGGTVSPDSSISQAEVRRVMKDYEDLKVSAAEYKASFHAKEKEVTSLRGFLKERNVKVPPSSPVVNPALSRSVYSLDEDGVLSREKSFKLIKAFPNAYVSNYFVRVDPQTGRRMHFIRPKAFPSDGPVVRA